MSQYRTPGVYVEEIPRGPQPIEGVPTSTAAFLGATERGPLRPLLVTSDREYARWFGGVFLPDQYMPHAVSGFFQNSGTRLHVARIAGAASTAAAAVFGGFTARAIGPGLWGNRVWLRVLPGRTTGLVGRPVGFRLRLAYWSEPNPPNFDPFEPANQHRRPRPQHTEEHDDLSIDPQAPNYVLTRLANPATNGPASSLVSIALTASGARPAAPIPTTGQFLSNGSDGRLPLTVADYVGEIDRAGGRVEHQGIRALEAPPYRDVSLVYAPFPANDPSNAIVKRIVAHCEEQRCRFAAIDGPNVDPAGLDPRNRQTGIADTPHAAYYAPWIVVADPISGARRAVPPGGHVLGIYARCDSERGVFKAPANEVVRGALDVRFVVNDTMQSALNLRGVNIIRAIPSRGILVWGARTLSSNEHWTYVSVRRLALFLERSIDAGTRWVVFEPNEEHVWAQVTHAIRTFLHAHWRAGAFAGRTEDEAFFVTCGRSTMTPDDIRNGRLVCQIGFAPARPAEFVIFRIVQRTVASQR